MASCCRVVSLPRMSAGDTSAMYAGATTDAAPTPNPPMRRERKKTPAVGDAPAPAAPRPHSAAVSSMRGLRPIRSAYWPASKAPIADPINTEETESPVPTLEEANSLLRAATVPLITAASKPKRKPARVATTHTNVRYASGLPVVRALIERPTPGSGSPNERGTAVHQQGSAGYVRAIVAGQEQKATCNLVRSAHPTEGNGLIDPLCELSVLVVDALREPGVDHAGSHQRHHDSVGCQLLCDDFGKHLLAGLAGAVAGAVGPRHFLHP